MSATSKQVLPQTLDELKALSFDERTRLWAKYSPHPFKRQMRALWYYVQCDRQNLRIEPKFLNKIKKYKDNPSECMTRTQRNKYNLAPGATIVKQFRGVNHEVLIGDDGTFYYQGRQYRSLSGIAREIAGIKISGPDFFGISKKGIKS